MIQAQSTVEYPSQFTHVSWYGELAARDLKHIDGLAFKYGVKRLDIVADTHHSYFIKETGGFEAKVLILFEENDKLPDNLPPDLLQNEENKTSFNLIIAQHASNP